jgi:hypothetical protein
MDQYQRDNHMRVMIELFVRNVVIETRQEIEEDELPINRLKSCIKNGLYAIVITILHSNSFSKLELMEAYDLALKYIGSDAVTKVMLDAIKNELQILSNNNEYILK